MIPTGLKKSVDPQISFRAYPEAALFLLACGQVSSLLSFQEPQFSSHVYTPSACHGPLVLTCLPCVITSLGQGYFNLQDRGGSFSGIYLPLALVLLSDALDCFGKLNLSPGSPQPQLSLVCPPSNGAQPSILPQGCHLVSHSSEADSP